MNAFSQPEKEKNFIIEVLKLCKKYGYSISHEDGQGSFLLDNFNEYDVKWLLCIGKESNLMAHSNDYSVFSDEEIESATQILKDYKGST